MGEVYFSYQTENSWHFGNTPHATVDNIKEYRYYVHDGALIRCLKKEYKIESDAKEKTDPSQVPNATTDCMALADLTRAFQGLQARQGQAGNRIPVVLCDED